MALYKRGNKWWIDIYVGATNKRIRISSGTDDKVKARIVEQTIIAVNKGVCVRQRAHEIIEAIHPEGSRVLPLEQAQGFYERCLIDDKITVSHHEQVLRMNMVGMFYMWAKDNTKIRYVSEVDEAVAWKFSTYLREYSPITTKTLNNKISYLKVCWKTFQRHGMTSVNPWGIARQQRDRSEEETGREFTEDEVNRILDVCKQVGGEWYEVSTTALYTGLRKRDCELIRWHGNPKDDLIADLEHGRIFGWPSKTCRRGIQVDIPMHKKLREVIESQIGMDEDFVFPFRAKHDPHRRTKADDVAFSEILDKAGVTAGEGFIVSFHSFRHTFNSWLSRRGVDMSVRMKLSGHTNPDTHLIYTHDEESKRKAIDSLP